MADVFKTLIDVMDKLSIAILTTIIATPSTSRASGSLAISVLLLGASDVGLSDFLGDSSGQGCGEVFLERVRAWQ